MLKKIFLTFIGLLSLGFLSLPTAKAQCSFTNYVGNKVRELSSDNFFYLKRFNFDAKAGEDVRVEFTCMLTEDETYKLHIIGKDGTAKGIVAILYNEDYNKITSNFHDSKFYDSWVYSCEKSGVYYLSFSFHKNSTTPCGTAILGFKR